LEERQKNELTNAILEFESDVDVVDQNIAESLTTARALNEKVTN
jgi:hypothetical protein